MYIERQNMTDKQKKAIVDLKVASIQMQHVTIGLFKHRGCVEPVVEYDEKSNMLRCIATTRFFGYGDTHISADEGEYIPFPDGKTMAQMLEKPFDWYHWYKDNKIK